MDFTKLTQYLDSFISTEFDHHTITDNLNNPLVQVSHIRTKPKFLSQTYSFYLTPPNTAVIHIGQSKNNLAAASLLTSQYLLQDPGNVARYIETFGCCDGFTEKNGNIILCAVVSNLDDAKWVCQTLLSQIRIIIS